MSHHVVRARPIWHSRLLSALLLLAAVLSAWGLYEFGRYRGGYDLLETQAQQDDYEAQLAALGREATQMREQKAIIERSQQIEREAYKQLEGTVTGLQDEILELKEELAFYRGIVSPTDASQGLGIQSFELSRRGTGTAIHYKLVLTQVLNNNTVASGNVAVSIEGEQGGKIQQYELSQLSEEDGELRFRFKYFQILEGDLHLPDGFTPSKVNITVKPRTRSHKRLSQSFDWTVQES
jgi:hypothetical protein